MIHTQAITIRLLTSPADLARYDAWVRSHPQGSVWQSLQWKVFQEARGRDVKIYGALEEAKIVSSALVVRDTTVGGLSTWEIPRGPLGDGSVMPHVLEEARRARCVTLYYSPVTPLTNDALRGAEKSGRYVQAQATLLVDLTPDEQTILAQMHQKGRYNIRVAERHGVTVEPSGDVEAFVRLLDTTTARDAFRGHSRAHYAAFLHSLPGSFMLMALSAAKEPIAALMGVMWPPLEGCGLGLSNSPDPNPNPNPHPRTGIYYYGASSHSHRALMAPYLLQWQAMRMCKEQGCFTYDLLGITPDGAQDHPWEGISAFKEKFGGSVVTYPPEQMIVLRPWAWRGLKMKRRILG